MESNGSAVVSGRKIEYKMEIRPAQKVFKVWKENWKAQYTTNATTARRNYPFKIVI